MEAAGWAGQGTTPFVPPGCGAAAVLINTESRASRTGVAAALTRSEA